MLIQDLRHIDLVFDILYASLSFFLLLLESFELHSAIGKLLLVALLSGFCSTASVAAAVPVLDYFDGFDFAWYGPSRACICI